MSTDWIYRVVVPAEKSDDFIEALSKLGLLDEDNLQIIKEGA